MINVVAITGRLVRDPELRFSKSGIAFCSFTLAVDRTFKSASGEREADFINVVAFRKTAELAAEYLRKGSMAGVSGRLQTRSYENNDGRRVFVTEVVAEQVQFLSPSGSGRSQKDDSGWNQTPNDPFAGGGKTIEIDDDDLPF